VGERSSSVGLYKNTVSYFGAFIIAISALFILGSALWGIGLAPSSPYIGIFTYMVFPGILTLGLALFLFGIALESLRRRRLGITEAPPFPRLDLNDPSHRRKFALALAASSILFLLLAFAGYNAFLFTESVTFCGKVCHTVMEPEHTAYLHSPHARVRCVDCHVGAGASWYVRSKLSGMRQVWAVLTNSYERPIPVPVANLRPARETCEECHWPQKFYGARMLQIPHFRYDEKNTAEQVSLLVKTGGGSPNLGINSGIHWHMVIENQVTFAAEDRHFQKIPWVRVKDNRTGRITTYTDKNTKLSKEQLEAVPRHTMDCMDCHNRPTHIFLAPDQAVDEALVGGIIPKDLPWMKKLAVDTLVGSYKDRNDAHARMARAIEGFYKENYPTVFQYRKADLNASVRAISGIYDRSIFPAMNVNWKTYAMNIGHRNWPGCFRCHDGKHVSSEGKVVTNECTACHTMPERGPFAPLAGTFPKSDMPWHPISLEGRHKEILCNQCHAAGYRPPIDCAECHKLNKRAPMMSGDCGTCHQLAGARQPQNECKGCHTGLGGLHAAGGHPSAACTDCHKPHNWKLSSRDTCLACHVDKKEHNAPALCNQCHAFGGTLKTALFHVANPNGAWGAITD